VYRDDTSAMTATETYDFDMRGRPRALNLIAAFLAAVVGVLYVLLISSQGTHALTDGRVVLVFSSLAGATILGSLAAISERRPLTVVLLSVSAFLLLAWTVLGMFSIGVLVAVPMLLMTAALVRELQDERAAVVAGAVLAGIGTLAVVGFGLAVT
jgi:hypothetical protein